jgi:signal transduction histidine kinase
MIPRMNADIRPISALTVASLPVRVLIIDDASEDRAVFRHLLGQQAEGSFDIQETTDLAQVRERVAGAAIAPRFEEATWSRLARVFSGGDDVVTAFGELHPIAGPARPVKLTASRLPMESQVMASANQDAFLAALSHELRRGQVDLHGMVKSAIAIRATDARAKQQRLSKELTAPRCQTEGDATRLQQAICNLLRNAVKFTPEGGAITLRSGLRDRVFWVEVSDTGIGFRPERREKIFEAFEQGGREITRQFGGLGPGLAISRSVAQAHGGSLRAESEGPGRGARFTLEVPLHPADSRPPLPVSAPPPARSWKILLVEDHGDTRRRMERWLRKNHHAVVAAESAAHAPAISTAVP